MQNAHQEEVAPSSDREGFCTRVGDLKKKKKTAASRWQELPKLLNHCTYSAKCLFWWLTITQSDWILIPGRCWPSSTTSSNPYGVHSKHLYNSHQADLSQRTPETARCINSERKREKKALVTRKRNLYTSYLSIFHSFEIQERGTSKSPEFDWFTIQQRWKKKKSSLCRP